MSEAIQLETPAVARRAQHRYAKAYRLADTRDLDRQAWLAIRRGGIGSSDAAAAVGLNPYQSALELWLDKTGRNSGEPSEAEDDPRYWGRLLEPLVAEAYAERTGNRVRRVNAILQHPEHPWMLADLDREVVGSGDVQVVEIKTAGPYGARRWQDGVPEDVQLQVQHQLAVTGQSVADVAVLLGGQELEIHRIERDEAVIERLIALEHQFWTYVEADTPPPADGSDSADRALRQLFPRDRGTTVDFTADPELAQAFTELQDVRGQLGALRDREARLKQRLQEAMGEATEAIFPTGRIRWKQTAPTRRLDTKALQADYPQLVARYQQEVPGARRFTLRD